MANTIADNAAMLLATLHSGEQDQAWEGKELVRHTNLSAPEVNNAISILESKGYVEWVKFLGTAPFEFGFVSITMEIC